MQEHENAKFIYEQWIERAKSRDVDALLELYSQDAVFESPLVMAILDDKKDGILRGKAEIRRFLEAGTKKRPNELVKWYRNGKFLTDGSLLVWEYPRQTPDGEQIDILELMELKGRSIVYHRIYWGFKGCMQIAGSLVKNS